MAGARLVSATLSPSPSGVAKGRTHASYGWPRTATLGLRGAGIEQENLQRSVHLRGRAALPDATSPKWGNERR
jgi:hypothetical protein